MRYLTIAIFVIYLFILAKLIIFKGPMFYEVVKGTEEYRRETSYAAHTKVNLVPFRTIKRFATTHPSTSTEAKFFNLAGNVALFIPFGILLPLVFKRLYRFRHVLFASILLSLFFETYQLVTRTGQFDVDDIILNTLGGIIGYWLLRLSNHKFGRRTVAA